MNVLLAEAEVPYEQVVEMEDINSDFGIDRRGVRARRQRCRRPAGRAAGQPDLRHADLEAHKSRTVIVNKRSMAAGYAGVDNPLFYMDKTMMVFGDAKKVVEDIVKALE